MDWTFYLFWGMVGVLIYLAIKIGKGGGNIGDSRRRQSKKSNRSIRKVLGR